MKLGSGIVDELDLEEETVVDFFLPRLVSNEDLDFSVGNLAFLLYSEFDVLLFARVDTELGFHKLGRMGNGREYLEEARLRGVEDEELSVGGLVVVWEHELFGLAHGAFHVEYLRDGGNGRLKNDQPPVAHLLRILIHAVHVDLLDELPKSTIKPRLTSVNYRAFPEIMLIFPGVSEYSESNGG